MEHQSLAPDDLARMLGTKKATVEDWIASRHRPQTHVHAKLARLLGVDVDTLLAKIDGDGDDKVVQLWSNETREDTAASNPVHEDPKRFTSAVVLGLERGDAKEPYWGPVVDRMALHVFKIEGWTPIDLSASGRESNEVSGDDAS